MNNYCILSTNSHKNALKISTETKICTKQILSILLIRNKNNNKRINGKNIFIMSPNTNDKYSK